MESVKTQVEEDGVLWRKLLSAEEDRRTDRSGGYRCARALRALEREDILKLLKKKRCARVFRSG
jgi:hypothetical protein